MTIVSPVTVPGEAIAPFEILATIGASMMTLAYLMCNWVMEQGYANIILDAAEKARLAPLANVIISVMHIRAMHEPVKDMKDKAYKPFWEQSYWNRRFVSMGGFVMCWSSSLIPWTRMSLLGHGSASPSGLTIWATLSGPASQVKLLWGGAKR